MAKLNLSVRYSGALGLLAAAAVTVLAAPPEPGFWLMGYPTGGNASGVQALSQDGSIAGGWTTSPGFGGAAFSWTAQHGRKDWGIGGGMPPYSPVYAMDSQGSAFAGWMKPGAEERAYRRVGDGPLENLGVLPNRTRSFAEGISGNGNVVVGYCESGPNGGVSGEAFRWTPTGGMQGLGYLNANGTYSVARGISRDGTTIVGDSRSFGPFGPQDAFVWTEAGGMKALPGLPNVPYIDKSAWAVNHDGSILVGIAPVTSGVNHAVRWSEGKIEDLGIAAGTEDSFALALSDDGSVVGGQAGGVGHNWAIVWTSASGMVMLKDYLALYGVLVPTEYRLEEVHAISGDGLTFGGAARNLLTNQIEGFVATVPATSVAGTLALSLVLTSHRRRRA